MITAIYSLSYLHGAEPWLLFWVASLVAYLVGCRAIGFNRAKDAFKRVLVALLIAEVAVDLVWALIYYHNGVLLSYGFGTMYGLLLWVPALVAAGVAATLENKRQWKRF